jgi:hypothetical protein
MQRLCTAFEVDLVIENLKRHKSLGIDQIPAEMIKARGRIIRSENHKLIISIRNNGLRYGIFFV